MKEVGDDEFVVLGAVFDEFDGGFEIVEEAVDVGEEDLDAAAGAEEGGDFEHGDEVAAVRAPGGCRAWRGGVRGGRKRVEGWAGGGRGVPQ